MTGRLYVGGDVSAETIARAVVRRTGGNARQCVSFRAKEIINGSPERRDHPSFASPRRIQRELTVRGGTPRRSGFNSRFPDRDGTAGSVTYSLNARREN